MKKIMYGMMISVFFGIILIGTAQFAGAEIDDYPEPFIVDGFLRNTNIVIGSDANAIDTISAVKLAVDLQQQAIVEESVLTGPVIEPTVTDGMSISTSGNNLNYGEDFNDIITGEIDDLELDTILSDEEYEDSEGVNEQDVEYEQMMSFFDGAGQFLYAEDNDEEAGDFLYFPQGDSFYEYKLEFDSPVEYESDDVNEDLAGTVIVIQGNEYTITEADESGGILDSLSLASGTQKIWLEQNNEYTSGSHRIEVRNVDADGEACGIMVDGNFYWFDEDESREFGNMTLTLLSAIALHGDFDDDMCQVLIGAKEIVMEDAESIEINGREIEGSEVSFLGTEGNWEGFALNFAVGEEDEGINKDEVYLAVGDSWIDPVFGNWKVSFADIIGNYETMELEAGSDQATFTFSNIDDQEVEISYFYNEDEDEIMLGVDDEEVLLLPGESSDMDPEGTMLLYTTSTGESHVLRVTDLNCGDGEITINDETYDDVLVIDQELENGCDQPAIDTISLGSLGSIQLALEEDSIAYQAMPALGNGQIESSNEASINLTSTTITVAETQGDEVDESVILVALAVEDDEIVIDSVDDDGVPADFVGEDDLQIAVTKKGSRIAYDTENKDELTIRVPEEDVYASAFLAPVSASVISGSDGVRTVRINPIGDITLTDDQVEGFDQNMILIGGPCVNSLSAQLLDNPTPCTEDFNQGQGRIQYFTRNKNTVVMVAGRDAQDTLAAATVLADIEDYAVMGELEIVDTNDVLG